MPIGGRMTADVVYTREQAEAVLPLVRAIVKDQRELYLRVRRSLAAYRGLESLEKVADDQSLPPGMREDLAALRGFMLELAELGVKVEDPDLGLVTMRGRRDGEVVNFCWKLGEDRVRFWFPIDATYAARRPLDPVGA
jgi:hypothetical protein